MTDTRSTNSRIRRADGAATGQAALGFEMVPPRRRVQVPQLMVAVLVVAVSAMVGMVLFSQAAAREPVVALATAVERGHVITTDDLRVVFVGTEDLIAAVGVDELSSLVGLAAMTDLAAGTLVTSELLVGAAALGTDEGVVGLALSPGDYPSTRLAVGDVVNVVDTEPGGGVVAPAAVVFDVADLGTQGQRFVSLRMPTEVATAVAIATGPGRLRLVLVSGETR